MDDVFQVLVTHSYKAKEEDELSIDVDETISVIEKVDEGWWKGEKNGKTGLFPKNFVQVISKDDENMQAELRNKMRNKNKRGKANHKSGRARYSYKPSHEDELRLEVGDKVEVLEEAEEGWLKASVGDRTGLIPKNFVEMMHVEEKKDIDKPEPEAEITKKKKGPIGGMGFGNIFNGEQIKLKSYKKIEDPDKDEKDMPKSVVDETGMSDSSFKVKVKDEHEEENMPSAPPRTKANCTESNLPFNPCEDVKSEPSHFNSPPPHIMQKFVDRAARRYSNSSSFSPSKGASSTPVDSNGDVVKEFDPLPVKKKTSKEKRMSPTANSLYDDIPVKRTRHDLEEKPILSRDGTNSFPTWYGITPIKRIKPEKKGKKNTPKWVDVDTEKVFMPKSPQESKGPNLSFSESAHAQDDALTEMWKNVYMQHSTPEKSRVSDMELEFSHVARVNKKSDDVPDQLETSENPQLENSIDRQSSFIYMSDGVTSNTHNRSFLENEDDEIFEESTRSIHLDIDGEADSKRHSIEGDLIPDSVSIYRKRMSRLSTTAPNDENSPLPPKSPKSGQHVHWSPGSFETRSFEDDNMKIKLDYSYTDAEKKDISGDGLHERKKANGYKNQLTIPLIYIHDVYGNVEWYPTGISSPIKVHSVSDLKNRSINKNYKMTYQRKKKLELDRTGEDASDIEDPNESWWSGSIDDGPDTYLSNLEKLGRLPSNIKSIYRKYGEASPAFSCSDLGFISARRYLDCYASTLPNKIDSSFVPRPSYLQDKKLFETQSATCPRTYYETPNREEEIELSRLSDGSSRPRPSLGTSGKRKMEEVNGEGDKVDDISMIPLPGSVKKRSLRRKRSSIREMFRTMRNRTFSRLPIYRRSQNQVSPRTTPKMGVKARLQSSSDPVVNHRVDELKSNETDVKKKSKTSLFSMPPPSVTHFNPPFGKLKDSKIARKKKKDVNKMQFNPPFGRMRVMKVSDKSDEKITADLNDAEVYVKNNNLDEQYTTKCELISTNVEEYDLEQKSKHKRKFFTMPPRTVTHFNPPFGKLVKPEVEPVDVAQSKQKEKSKFFTMPQRTVHNFNSPFGVLVKPGEDPVRRERPKYKTKRVTKSKKEERVARNNKETSKSEEPRKWFTKSLTLPTLGVRRNPDIGLPEEKRGHGKAMRSLTLPVIKENVDEQSRDKKRNRWFMWKRSSSKSEKTQEQEDVKDMEEEVNDEKEKARTLPSRNRRVPWHSYRSSTMPSGTSPPAPTTGLFAGFRSRSLSKDGTFRDQAKKIFKQREAKTRNLKNKKKLKSPPPENPEHTYVRHHYDDEGNLSFVNESFEGENALRSTSFTSRVPPSQSLIIQNLPRTEISPRPLTALDLQRRCASLPPFNDSHRFNPFRNSRGSLERDLKLAESQSSEEPNLTKSSFLKIFRRDSKKNLKKSVSDGGVPGEMEDIISDEINNVADNLRHNEAKESLTRLQKVVVEADPEVTISFEKENTDISSSDSSLMGTSDVPLSVTTRLIEKKIWTPSSYAVPQETSESSSSSSVGSVDPGNNSAFISMMSDDGPEGLPKLNLSLKDAIERLDKIFEDEKDKKPTPDYSLFTRDEDLGACGSDLKDSQVSSVNDIGITSEDFRKRIATKKSSTLREAGVTRPSPVEVHRDYEDDDRPAVLELKSHTAAEGDGLAIGEPLSASDKKDDKKDNQFEFDDDEVVAEAGDISLSWEHLEAPDPDTPGSFNSMNFDNLLSDTSGNAMSYYSFTHVEKSGSEESSVFI